MAKQRDPFAHLSETDLRLVARARGLDIPDDADRNTIVAVLVADETPTSVASPSNRKPTAERLGWWSAVSLSELRNVARGHGIDVAAGMRRRELVELLIEREVPRPARRASTRIHRH
jgi:hypothetical protein